MEFFGDIALEDLQGEMPGLNRLRKMHGKAHGRNRFRSEGAVRRKLDEIRAADERDQRVFDELATDQELSEGDRWACLVDARCRV